MTSSYFGGGSMATFWMQQNPVIKTGSKQHKIYRDKPASAGYMRLIFRVIDHRGMNSCPQQMDVGIDSVLVVNRKSEYT
jgi:hypothetical protein